MARRYRLREVEQQRGDLHKVIPPLVNSHGQRGAADALNITQATVSRWLKDNGYSARTVYERQADRQPA